MEDLLTYQEKRVINICKELIIGQKSLTIASVEKLNDCSRRTVYLDIQYLEERYNHLLGLSVKDNLINIKSQSVGNLQLIVRDIANNSNGFKIMKLLFLEPFEPIEHYALELNISESSALLLLRNINKEYNSLGFSVKRNDEGYFLFHENEHALRYFITYLLLNMQESTSFFEHHVHLDASLTLIRHISDEYGYLIGDVPVIILAIMLKVSLIREKQGFHIEYEIPDFEFLKYKYVKKAFNLYEDDEILGAIQTILQVFFNHEQYLLYKPHAIKHLRTFIKQTDLELTNLEKNNLINIIIFLGIVSKYHYINEMMLLDRSELYGRQFKTYNPQMYSQIERIFKNASDDLGKKIYDSLNHFLFFVLLETPSLYEKKQLNIAVLSDFGFNHSFMLTETLKRHFDQHHYLVSTTFHDRDSTLKDYLINHDIDLLILTTQPPTKIDTPFVVVNDYLTGNDIKKIYTAINQLS